MSSLLQGQCMESVTIREEEGVLFQAGVAQF